MEIKAGDIIESPRWEEPVEVKLINYVGGDYVQLVGVTVRSRKHIDQLISKADLADATVRKIESHFTADPLHVFLALESKRYRYANLYDPLLAVNTSKVDPLPHQIEAVYGFALKLPRIRFLIADDPGAGKTIMAGLIIKELKLRHLVKRILIVVPGHLKDQWRRELKERFEEHFMVIDRGFLDVTYGENAWDRENQVITSIDFSKRDEILPSLSSTHFDLIIADEAHKMSAYRYGDKLDKTSRYRLGETLSRIGTHLLFLTATPHKGDPENFRLFLDLLEPGFFATAEMLQESISSRDNPLFIRRVKEDLKDFEGKPLFLPRHVRTLSFNLGTDSPAEKELYNQLSEYVNTQYNKALSKDKKRNVAFALVILQRRFASSVYALLRSLERRKKRLIELLEGPKEGMGRNDKTFDFDTTEDLSEEDRWKEEELWETLSVAETREELQKEISILEDLEQKARKIIEQGEEIKLRELRSTLDHLDKEFSGKKILIFTESRDTLEYLAKRMVSWGYSVNTIHGGLRLEDRITEESRFRNETQVLIATEAAGEGINLQFCNLMINYDIPWNPNRLEQRMGRIHRYGQTQEVYVFNLVAEDTREGKVLTRLFAKIEEIKAALGSDKVFDVLSEVLYGKNLSQLLLDAAANARNLEDILKEIEIHVDEEYIAKVKENLGDSLATHYIDYTRLKEMNARARESRLIPEYTEGFFRKVFQLVGGRVKDRKDSLLAIEGVPAEIRQLSYEDDFKRRYGVIQKSYPKATFDKEMAFKNPDAEFLCFGHPVFESSLCWVEKKLLTTVSQGATFRDPDEK
ncbi:MAG: DEAD/DEAH box helicase, partial [Deltaproteobacteria bacterium]|nr:DEAD/DEAH box helicase [Deltaproteobacteria bacterium]